MRAAWPVASRPKTCQGLADCESDSDIGDDRGAVIRHLLATEDFGVVRRCHPIVDRLGVLVCGYGMMWINVRPLPTDKLEVGALTGVVETCPVPSKVLML